VERRIDEEPTWAHAHRRQLRGRRAVHHQRARRFGQPPSRPQVCLCPIVRSDRARGRLASNVGASNEAASRSSAQSQSPTAPGSGYSPWENACPPSQRGSRTTTGSSRFAIDL
jgi:hypothetical protein